MERGAISSKPISNKQITDLEKNLCKDELEREYDRYYITVRLTLTLKKALEKYKIENIQFVQAEYKLKSEKTSKEVVPDVLLEDSTGKLFLFEIKSSVPFKSEYLEKELLELPKYDDNLIMKNGVISKNHNIIFLCPLNDFESIENMIESLGDAFNFSKNFSIWTWAEINALRPGAPNSIVIERKIGEISNLKLNEVSKHIKIDDFDLIDVSEKSIFVPLQPPDVYLLVQLFSQIFPGIFPQDKKNFIPIEEIIETTKAYYLSWAGDQRTQSQIRSRWIKRGLKILIDLGLAEKSENEEFFVQAWPTKRTKDIKALIIRGLCDRELMTKEIERREKQKAEILKKQQRLDQFLI